MNSFHNKMAFSTVGKSGKVLALQLRILLIFLGTVSVMETFGDGEVPDVAFTESDGMTPGNVSQEPLSLEPTVFIPVFARNKEHTLPTFFGCLERLRYPKKRISLWIQTDHNLDKTSSLLLEWVNKSKSLYHRIDINIQNEPDSFDWENGPSDWPDERYMHLIQLRQGALVEARRQWADYLFAVDVDNFLENPDVLQQLMSEGKTVIAPMLVSTKMYSNFWGGMTRKGYYKRTEQYVHILKRNVTGIFEVPMVHSTYLVNLRHRESTQLTYNPLPGFTGDLDDMLTFAFSAQKSGIPLYVSNKEYYGSLLIPLESKQSLKDDFEQMLHLRLESMVKDAPLPLSESMKVASRQATKLGFDEIYMINLKRRPERRRRMIASLRDLGIAYKVVDAVDGRALTDDDLKELGVDMLPGYRDPYHERVLTRGEIGCFLSHYFIWQDMVANNYNKILIFEDDVRFKESFRPKLKSLLHEINSKKLDWELMYIGRKIMDIDYEKYVDGFYQVVKPSYTYWTLSYMLTFTGAKKLLAQEPLGKMIPVDEYIPIMFDVHPEDDWAYEYYPRDLKAFSVNPLLVEPTHYTGEAKYTSDTETKDIWEYVLEREGSSHSNNEDKDGKMPKTNQVNETKNRTHSKEASENSEPDTEHSTAVQDVGTDRPKEVNTHTEL